MRIGYHIEGVFLDINGVGVRRSDGCTNPYRVFEVWHPISTSKPM